MTGHEGRAGSACRPPEDRERSASETSARAPSPLAPVAAALAGPVLPAAASSVRDAATALGGAVLRPDAAVRAGAAVVDATWDVGAAAGQYPSTDEGVLELVLVG